MFPLKSNPLPWKRFSLRSKQGMDRKEQGACKWISEREQHLCKDDEAAAGQTRKLLEKSESAGDRGRPAEPLLPPKRGDGVRKARVCECSLKTPQVSLCDHGDCLWQEPASTEKEKGQGHAVLGRRHKGVEQRSCTGSRRGYFPSQSTPRT